MVRMNADRQVFICDTCNREHRWNIDAVDCCTNNSRGEDEAHVMAERMEHHYGQEGAILTREERAGNREVTTRFDFTTGNAIETRINIGNVLHDMEVAMMTQRMEMPYGIWGMNPIGRGVDGDVLGTRAYPEDEDPFARERANNVVAECCRCGAKANRPKSEGLPRGWGTLPVTDFDLDILDVCTSCTKDYGKMIKWWKKSK